MANFLIIRDLCESKNITIRELASKVDMSDISIHSLIKKGRTNTETLEKIAKILGVPIGIFFDESPLHAVNQNAEGTNIALSAYGDATVTDCEGKLKMSQKENEHLNKLLEEKERTIQILINK
jgi:transcriptional regulator with XRE-family HTH domain